MKSLTLFFAALAAITPLAAAKGGKATVHVMRHAEKPDDDDQIGLSSRGVDRSLCIRKLFGPGSEYNVGLVAVQGIKSDGSRTRPFLTGHPLAADWDLNIDLTCDRDDADCVGDLVDNFDGDGDIVVFWEHDQMNNVAEAIGVDDVENYPDGVFDLIWTIAPPYNEIVVSSQNCPGLDD